MDPRTEPKAADPLAVDRAADDHAVKVSLTTRSLLSVTGEERIDFLHRICSQDILGMSDGEGRPATLLTPKGKVAAILVAWRFADRVLLEADRQPASEVLALLDRFLFREKVSLADVSSTVRAAAVLGPRAAEPVRTALGVEPPSAGRGALLSTEPTVVLLSAIGLGRLGFVLYAPGPELDRFRKACGPIASAGDEDLERWRIRAGIAAFGKDTDERTIPLEANLDDAVSVTKGCYVGQEIIARIHTYGHVNRKLVLVETSASGSGSRVPAPGATLFAEGEAVGRITSATFDPSAGTAIALAYLPRALASPGERLAVEKDGPPVATVVAPRGSS